MLKYSRLRRLMLGVPADELLRAVLHVLRGAYVFFNHPSVKLAQKRCEGWFKKALSPQS